jgi:spermidine synthase
VSESRSTVSTRLSSWLLVAFFLSGGVALIYQVLWTRQLGHVFGVTIQAASTVLACFMAGLAIGSYLAGRWSDSMARPLRAFAIVELLIAVSALLTPTLLGVADSIFVGMAPSLEGAPILTTIARISLTALVLIVPGGLMGMTYPLVLRAASRTADGIRRTASLLYAINTTGAIVGVLFGSLWLVPTLGLRATFLAAAAINVLVAAVAWVASRDEVPLASAAASAAASPHAEAPSASLVTTPLTDRARWTVLLVIALSGTVTLALEIIWFRILVFFLRPTTYAFASMLAAVLVGLAIGSYLVTPWLRRRANWLAILGATEIAIGLTAVLSAFALVRAHDVMSWMWVATEAMTPPWDFVLPLLIAAAFAILPTAILLGAAFPMGLILWTTGGRQDDSRVGRRVGMLYALNVAGAIIGSLAGGFVLIPTLGAQTSLVLIAAIPLLGGLALFWMAQPRLRIPVVAVSAAAFVVAAVVLPDVFQDVITRRYPGHHVLWHAEDAQATVSVVRHGDQRVLLIDGMHHASDGASMVGYHRAIGTLAVAVHHDPRNVLIVGMGGGTTGGGASILPNSRTTIVELSPSVITAGSWFAGINRNILENPNVRFKVADGRHFLKTTPERFDVITADLMLPHLAGAASLYSSDYFALARRALAPGGIMVQWIPGDSEFQHKLMLRSFLSVFPHVTMWMGGSIAIGSNEPLLLDEADFALKVAYPAVQAALTESGMGTFEDLVGQYFSGRAEMERYLGPGDLLRDDRPITEYFLSLPANQPPVDLTAYEGPRAAIMRRP